MIVEGILFLWFIGLGIYTIFSILTPNLEIKPNSDKKALQEFLDLLKKSDKSVKIFDDGIESDSNSNSIYNDDSLIEAISSKLENSELKIEAHFNYAGESKFIKEFENSSKVTILYNQFPEYREEKQWHFKIFDDGKYCYASVHKKDCSERKYFVYEDKLWHAKHPRVLQLIKQFNHHSNSDNFAKVKSATEAKKIAA